MLPKELPIFKSIFSKYQISAKILFEKIDFKNKKKVKGIPIQVI